jgi:hypothetical protein
MMQGDTPVGNMTFRADRYAPDFPGFGGRDLTPGAPIEIYDATGVEDHVGQPRSTLSQDYPNPFHPLTTIVFSLRDPAPVTLDVYDVGGRHVATLVNQRLGAGENRHTWRANDLPSGVYHYTLRVKDEKATRRMTIVR